MKRFVFSVENASGREKRHKMMLLTTLGMSFCSNKLCLDKQMCHLVDTVDKEAAYWMGEDDTQNNPLFHDSNNLRPYIVCLSTHQKYRESACCDSTTTVVEPRAALNLRTRSRVFYLDFYQDQPNPSISRVNCWT